jgi:tetratricopeptide (TPR) repeat protein
MRVVRGLSLSLLLSLAAPAATGVAAAGPEERRVRDDFRRVVDRALAATDRVEHADMRATLFAQVAEAQVKAGEADAARATLTRAREAARRVPDPEASWVKRFLKRVLWETAESARQALYRDIVFERVAKAHARAGEFAHALDTAREIRDDNRRLEALVEVAAAQTRSGRRDEARASLARALETAEAAQRAKARAEFLATVAREQVMAGDREAARETFSRSLRAAETLASGADRELALVFIGSQQVKAQDLAGALDTVAKLRDPTSRIGLLTSIARQRAQGRQPTPARELLAQALEMATKVEDATLRAAALDDVAEVQAEMGDLAGAMATAMRMPERARRPMRLRWIARDLARSGQFPLALRAANSLPETAGDAQLRAFALADIALAQAGARQFAQSLATAATIEQADIGAGTLADIAAEQEKAGGAPAAARTFSAALEMARGLAGPRERASALARVAERLTVTDEGAGRQAFARALAAAGGVEEPSFRMAVLVEIGQGQARAGARAAARDTFARALKSAAGIEDAGYRARALEDAARALAEVGEAAQAIEAAEAGPTPYGRAASLAQVADIVAEMLKAPR